MAVGAKRLIPKCMGAGILFPGALSGFVCLSLGVCHDPPQQQSAPKFDLKAEIQTGEDTAETKLFELATRNALVELIRYGMSEPEVSNALQGIQ